MIKYVNIQDVMPINTRDVGKAFVELYNNTLYKTFGVTLSNVKALNGYPKYNKKTEDYVLSWFFDTFPEEDKMAITGLFVNKGFDTDNSLPEGVIAVEEEIIEM